MAPYIYSDLAVSYRLSAEIEHVLDQRSRQVSVSLASVPSLAPAEALGRGASVWLEVARSFPVDWEADARVEKLIAAQPKSDARRPLRRK